MGCLLALVPLVGCNGCRPGSQADDDKKASDGPKEAFTFRSARPFPRGEQPASDRIKPGHWTTASVSLRSNQTDSRGRLIARTRMRRASPSVSMTGSSETESPMRDSGIRSVRPVVMPKGQRRRFDFRVLPPAIAGNSRGRCYIDNQFVADASSVFELGSGPVATMPNEEYFLVVLTTRAERFGKMASADWIAPPRQEQDFAKHVGNYRMVIPPSDDLLPLSDTVLDWTSTAVVIWDNLPAEGLTPDQLRAMKDWLHFGGRLIVNGPDAAESINDTMLADYLPVRPTGNVELDGDAASKLLSTWAIEGDNTTDKQTVLLNSESSRVALDGRPAKNASSVPDTEDLFYQAPVGRGVVVQSRFDVNQSWFSDWRSWDGFVNGVLLRRPARRYVVENDSAIDEEFGTEFGTGTVNQIYPDLSSPTVSAAINTGVRFLSRDSVLAISSSDTELPRGKAHLDSKNCFRNDAGSLAAWNDNSDVIRLCSEVLKDESGIEIPKSSLVIRSLGWYLLALVPINYLVFRLFGRPEYAWLAVPVIAIGGAIWVARAARLDIGFARSMNQIAVMEVPTGYDRAHLCRVAAIYNSLSSTYDFAFAEVDAAAVAMGTGSVRSGDEEAAVEFRTSFSEGPVMGGLQISSNQVRMIHAEQVVDVGGGFSLTDSQLVNQSDLELLDAVVVRRKGVAGGSRPSSDPPPFEVANVGLLSPQSSQKLKFKASSNAAIVDDLPMSIERVMRALASQVTLLPGETRLIGRFEGTAPSMVISPQAGQVKEQTIVVAHLGTRPLQEVRKDRSLKPLPRRAR